MLTILRFSEQQPKVDGLKHAVALKLPSTARVRAERPRRPNPTPGLHNLCYLAVTTRFLPAGT